MARPSTITNEQILEAARAIFLEKGFAASTAAIARRAGVSEGSIFKRFATKEELFLAAMGVSEGPAPLKNLQALVGTGSVKENLLEIGMGMLAFLEELLPRVTMVWSTTSPAKMFEGMSEPPPVKGLKMLTNYLDAEQRLGRIRRCDPELAARTFLGGLLQYAFFDMIGANRWMPLAAPTYVRGLVEVIWLGLEP
ncbi:TetR/AcrR family transcriptional regulator [Vulgatibacter sp.]|uniref:TetR/AcrR family transcriptional regulator n=1 Tax=Vulgatibacter sp. TaxID=1971226 RepID=UPI003563E941